MAPLVAVATTGGVCVQRIWTKQMSRFGNNLIERLRTRLIDVQPQNQLGEVSIALAKNLNSNRNPNATTGRADCPVSFLAGSRLSGQQ